MVTASDQTKPRVRLRDLGITIGRMPPGRHNAITDVAGVRVGHATVIAGEGPLRVGEGPVRTGVTVIMPHEGDIGMEPLFAGFHVLNGNGEMTGLLWVKESGLLTTPIAITNTHSVGVVRDAPILILDEPTSGLDAAATNRVMGPLRRLMSGRATIVISHNLVTVREATEIVVLEEGRIVERGSHDALLAMDGAYARLYRLHHPDVGSTVNGRVRELAGAA